MHGSRCHIMLLTVILALLVLAAPALGQTASVTSITGLVRDSLSREGIAYASISLMGTSEGTIANDKGGFNINTRASFTRLRISAMGYKTKEVEIKPGQGSVILVDLVSSGVELDEVVVRKGKEKYSKKDNPAVEMIRKLRAAATITTRSVSRITATPSMSA